MQHPDEGTIHAWLDGERSAEEVAALEAHVAECAECSARVAEARGFIVASSRIVSALDIIPAGVIPVVPPRISRPWYTGVQFRAAAAVLVVAAASLLLLKRGNQENAARSAIAISDTQLHVPASPPPLPSVTSGSAVPAVSAPSANRETAPVARAPVALQKKKSEPKATDETRELSATQVNEAARPTAQATAPEKVLDAPANAVVGGVAMADAMVPSLTPVKTDTSADVVRSVYEVSPGIQVTLIETSSIGRNFTASTAAKAQRATVAAPPTAAPAPSPAPSPPPSMRRAKLAINTITWMKGTRTMTLTGPISVEELTALRMRLPEDKR